MDSKGNTMNIEDFRNYCLSLPGTTEGTPFEKFTRGRLTILVFYINRRMYCYFNIDDFSEITIRCAPDEMDELKERYEAVGNPYNGNRRHWIGVKTGADMPDSEILELVRKSYLLAKTRK
mgnify:CR=1 FL=1